MYDIVKLLHLIAAIVWMGGMAFMLVALRPAAIAVLDGPTRLRLMGAVWQRFFLAVALSIVVLFTTGTNLYTILFRATKLASGTGGVPLGWNIMLALGLLMMLVFAHIYFAGYAKFKRASAGGDLVLASKAATTIHTLMLINFVLGWLAIAAVRLVH